MSSTTKVSRRRVRFGSLVMALVALALTIVFFSVPLISGLLLAEPSSPTATIAPSGGVTVTPGAEGTPTVAPCPVGYVCTPVSGGTSGTFLGLPSDVLNGISLVSGLLTLVGFFIAGGRFLLGLVRVGQPGRSGG